MPGEELPDPPIPDMPTFKPIGLPGRSTRRGATRTVMPKPPLPSLRPGDRVLLHRHPDGRYRLAPVAGTVDRVLLYRPPVAGPARYLVDDDDGGRAWYASGDLVPDPPKVVSPVVRTPTGYVEFAEGDKVRVGPPTGPGGSKLHTGAVGVIRKMRPPTTTGAIPVSVTLSEDCPCSCRRAVGQHVLLDRDRFTLLESDAPTPRLLVIAIPLTDDPSEDPTTVTELIDHIAEHHEAITFAPPEGPRHHG